MDERHVGLDVEGDRVKKVVTETPNEHLKKPVGKLISETLEIMEAVASDEGFLELSFTFPQRNAKVKLKLDIKSIM